MKLRVDCDGLGAHIAAPRWKISVPFTTEIDVLWLVKLDPSQYLTTTEFQSENPGLKNGSDDIKKRPGYDVNAFFFAKSVH